MARRKPKASGTRGKDLSARVELPREEARAAARKKNREAPEEKEAPAREAALFESAPQRKPARPAVARRTPSAPPPEPPAEIAPHEGEIKAESEPEMNGQTPPAEPEPEEAGETRPRLYLIDAYAYIFRAYHALPPLATGKGVPTGATYGFITALLKILREGKPDYVAVVWDAPGGNFRDRLSTDYKATRTEPLPDLVPQFTQVRRVTDAFNIPTIEVEDFEADDVIGALSRQAVAAGCDVMIVSGDKDLMQLVNGRVKMYDIMREKIYDPAAVVEKFGVPPERISDYLALVGDTSDNVPGVSGIGPKTASTLLNKFGSLDAILAHVENVESERIRNNIVNERDKLDLSRKLVALADEVPVAFDKEKMTVRSPDAEKLRPLLVEFEFNKLIPQFAAPSAEKKALTQAGYRAVLDDAALREMLADVEEAERFSIHLETNGEDLWRSTLVGVAVCADLTRSWYVPLEHRYLGVPSQLSPGIVMSALKPFLQDAAKEKVAHDSKRVRHLLGRIGIVPAGFFGDTSIANYLLNPERTNQDLAVIAQELLDYTLIPWAAGLGKGGKTTMSQVPIEQAMQHAAEIAHVAFLCSRRLEEKLKEVGRLAELYRNLEIPLVPVLAKMEAAGVCIDSALLARLSAEYETQIKEVEAKAYDVAGQTFNIGSPIQLRQILFEKMKLPILRRTKTGPSTDVDVLEKLAERHALPALILQYRSRSKLKSTYMDALPKMLAPDGRIHTTFNQAVAATGRLSSSEPNLQNIPIRTDEGRKIRQAFVAAPGHKFVAADYSQMELRLVASYSGEPAMIDAFKRGEDIHAATARAVFGAEGNDYRSRAKAINFGIIYGLTPFGLAKQLNISRPEAEKYIGEYNAKYPNIRTFLDAVVKEAEHVGFVETKFGRRRYFGNLRSRNPMLRDADHRAAINHPIQGTAADLMKMAMLAVDERLAKGELRARLLLQIHDELVFECPAGEEERVATLARETMESVGAALPVPLKVDVGIGDNWDET